MKDDGIKLDQKMAKVLLDSLIRSGKFDSALGVLDYMEELGDCFFFFNDTFLWPRAHIRERGTKRGPRAHIRERGDCLNPSLYDSVIVALVKKKELRLAVSILFKLLEASDNHGDDTGGAIVSYLPGTVAVNELLVGLRRADMRLEFKSVYEKLKELERFKFDTWGYNICIYGFGCWGDLDAALSLFKEMKEKSSVSGSSIGPDICTYNSLIHVLCLFGKVKDALIIWDELKKILTP